MLLDRLICGINHEKWQQRLLAEGDKLMYDKAHKRLLALEAAEKEVKDIAGEKSVHQLRLRSTKSQPPSRPPSQGTRPKPLSCENGDPLLWGPRVPISIDR